jgi:hypothetical protein
MFNKSFFAGILKVTDEKSSIRIRIRESVLQIRIRTKNVTDPHSKQNSFGVGIEEQ